MKRVIRVWALVAVVLGIAGCPESSLDSDAGRDTGIATDPDLTCEDISKSLISQMASVLARAPKEAPCVTPSDCVSVDQGVDCHPSCSTYLSSAAAKTVQAVAAGLNSDLCARYRRKACLLNPVPPCVPLEIPNACVDGVCAYQL